METKFKIEDEVQIVTGCRYESQGIKNGKKIKGVITSINDSSDLPYGVQWSEGSGSNTYRDEHLEKYGTIDKPKLDDWLVKIGGINIGTIQQVLSVYDTSFKTSISGDYTYSDWTDYFRFATKSEIDAHISETAIIAIQAECKRRFPIGCKFGYGDNKTELLYDEETYTIHNNGVYAHSGAGYLYQNGEYAKVELMPEGFSPSEYIQGKEKEKEYVMIEEAKKRYPIGTMFKPAQCKTPNSEFCVVTNTNFKFQNGHVYALTDTGGIWTDAGKYGNTQSNRIVYHGDKKVWADYHNPQIITSIAGFSGLSIQHEKQDTKTFINDVLSVDIKLSKKKKRIRF